MIMAGRGRLSSFELLPPHCAPVIAWARDELQKRERTQTEIYEEFYGKMEALQREFRGEMDFVIPAFSSFNRYSVRLATMTGRMTEAREITSALAEKFDAADSDNLTLIAGEAIKTLVFELLTSAGEAGMAPKDAMQLAAALRAAAQAQGVSTKRRSGIEKEFAAKANEAVSKVVKLRGLSKETGDSILQFLGVAPPTDPSEDPDFTTAIETDGADGNEADIQP